MKKIVLLLLCIVYLQLLCADTYTRFSHYSVRDGLSEINVLCMLQDRKGQMWFGTFDGLNKFNGYTFKTYKYNPDRKFGLENYRVDRICEDKQGYLWLLTYDGRVNRFDQATEKFLQVPQCTPDFKSYKLNIFRIMCFADGSTWLTGGDDGCFRIENISGSEEVKVTHFSESNGQLSSNKVNSIFQDKQFNTWILTDNGLNMLKHGADKPEQLFREKTGGALYSICEDGTYIWLGGDHGKVRIYNSRKQTFDGLTLPCESPVTGIHAVAPGKMFFLSRNNGFYLYQMANRQFKAFTKENHSGVISDVFYTSYMDRDHNVWIETDNPSVVLFRTKEEQVTNFTIKTVASSQYSPLPNFYVVEDNKSNIWVHPRMGGFSLYDRTSNTLLPFHNAPDAPDRKFSNMMHSAYSDRQGNLWLCPFSHGIEKVVFSHSPFRFFKPQPAETTSAANEIRSLYQDRSGRIWAGAKNGYVTVFDKHYHPIGEVSVTGHIGGGTALKASVYTIFQDSRNRIWLGSKGNGLYLLEPTAGSETQQYSIRNFRYDPNDMNSLSSNNVYHIFEDRFHRIWIATYGGGINLFQENGATGYFLSPRNKLRNYPMAECYRARYLTEDKKGRILVGTTGGMVVFENRAAIPDDMQFGRISHDPANPKSISGNDVHYILPAKDGKLYLAIFGGGINILDHPFAFNQPNVFRSLMVENGAPSNVIYTLREDRQGNIWFSTQTDIARFNTRSESFDTYTPVNDNSYSFVEAAVCNLSANQLAYGTTEGFVTFNPLQPLKSSFVPRIILTGLQLFNKTVEVGVDGSPLDKAIDDIQELVLEHKQNIFSISFAALDYTSPQNIQYAYKLDGFEKDWNYVHDQRIATYTNLPKGKYVFRVKSTNAEGVWVENERSLVIIKQPSFWESYWGVFIFISSFVLLLLLVMYVLYVIFRLKSNVEVEHRITNMKLRFFTDISHELRTPLTLIASPVEHILQNESLSEQAKEQLSLVQRNTDRMLRLINQILDFRKIQNKKMKLLIEEIHPGSFMQEICQNFTRLAQEAGIKFELIDESNNATLWADKDKFEKIFYNLLSNAFKFTQSGHPVTVHITEEKEHLHITITDRGTGISKDRIKLLFNRFESLAVAGSFQQGTGIGLSLTRELVELHHAQIAVESEEGSGSSFKVTFKKGHAHFSDSEEIIEGINAEPGEPEHNIPDTCQDTEDTTGEHDEPDTAEVHPTGLTPEEITLLLVEDNPEMRSFLRSVLKKNYKVIEAANGDEGLEAARNHTPDLIISDIMMPGLNGLELAKAIKEDINISHIPLILLTAKSDMENKLEALQYGVDDYITKPFSAAYLEARVDNLLKLRRQLQSLYRSSLTSGVISPSKPNVVSQDDVFLQRIMAYIEENIENSELTIDDIALHIGFSRSAFFKKLKSLTGLAPVEFLREVRIQRAAQLIETGEYNFSEITYMVGISDPRYFSRCFKQKYGMSPREYKEKCNPRATQHEK